MASSDVLYMSGSFTPYAAASSGRMKTEQVVLECIYKVAEVLVQSRINFQSEGDMAHRRARFNLDVDEIEYVRSNLSRWKSEPHVPLYIDLYWDPESSTSASRPGRGLNLQPLERGSQIVLLERWIIHFCAEGGLSVGSTGVIAQLRQVCKRIGVLLRAVFSLVRLMPAHQLFLRSKGTPSASSMGYAMYGADEANSHTLEFASDVATNRYTFNPIETPCGLLKITTNYRRDCSFAIEETRNPILMPNIILDYVGREECKDGGKLRVEDLEEEGEEEGTFLVLKAPTPDASGPSHETRDRSGSMPMAIPQSKNHGKPISSIDSVYSKTEIRKTSMEKPIRKTHSHSFGEADHYIGHNAAQEFGTDEVQSQSPPNWYQPVAAPYGYGNAKDGAKPAGNSAPKSSTIGTSPNLSRGYDARFIPPRHPNTTSHRVNHSSSPADVAVRRRYMRSSSDTANDTSSDGIFADGKIDGKMTRYSGGNMKSMEDTSPLMTPPFSFSSSLNSPSPFSLDMPAFGSSPPFLSNPAKLLSGSPQQHSSTLILSASPQESPNLRKQPSSGNFNTSIWGIGHSTGGHSSSASIEEEQISLPPFAYGGDELPFTVNSYSSVTEREHGESKVQTATASLGTFVHQMKNAPPLMLFSKQNSNRKDISKASISTTSLDFEDELEKYRRLRDELTSK